MLLEVALEMTLISKAKLQGNTSQPLSLSQQLPGFANTNIQLVGMGRHTKDLLKTAQQVVTTHPGQVGQSR